MDIGRDAPAYSRIEGVLVAEVERGSPAWRHGLRAGDVVIGVNRQKTTSLEGLRAALEEPARPTTLHLVRGRRQIVVVVQ